MKIVIFSGGRGSGNLYKGLKDYCRDKNISARISLISNAYDDGMSTGEVRRLVPGGVLGPSDIRKLQETQYNYLFSNKAIKQFFSFRYVSHKAEHMEDLRNLSNNKSPKNPSLSWYKDLPLSLKRLTQEALKYLFLNTKIDKLKLNDFAFSNLIYAGLCGIYEGSLQQVETKIRENLNLTDPVILNSNENKFLFALTEDGKLLHDEASIVSYKGNSPIYNIYFADKFLTSTKIKVFSTLRSFKKKKIFCQEISSLHPKINKLAANEIKEADLIVYSAGTQYSSLFPSYFTEGMSESISQSTALKIMITNIMPDNESPEMTSVDFLRQAMFYFNRKGLKEFDIKNLIDIVFANDPTDFSLPYIKPNRLELENFGIRNFHIDKRFHLLKKSQATGKHDPKFLAKQILDYSQKTSQRTLKKISTLQKGILAFDLDGTLFADRRSILIRSSSGSILNVDKTNLNLILELLEKGQTVLIMSGNDYKTIYKYLISPLINLADKNSKVLSRLFLFANGSSCFYKYCDTKLNFILDQDYSYKHQINSKDSKIIYEVLKNALIDLKKRCSDKKEFYKKYDKSIWKYENFSSKPLMRGENSQLVIKPIPSSMHFLPTSAGQSERNIAYQFILKSFVTKKISKNYDVIKRGWGTIEVQKKGINKFKALSYFMKLKNIDKSDILFFGNELDEDGNDFSIIENNINIIGVTKPRELLETKYKNIFYGGRRGVASTGFHLNALLELYEDRLAAIKLDPSLNNLSLPKLYIEMLNSNIQFSKLKSKLDLKTLEKALLG